MKKIKFLYLFLLILVCASCAKDQWFDPPPKGPGNNNSSHNLISPKIKIAVVSDIHYLDPALMPDDYVTNEDFQKMMTGDRKLIELSDLIFRKAIEEIIDERPDILMIPGDLSFNGEYSSHLIVSGFLEEIEAQGIKVYVVPGNNDIWSSEALNYKTIPASETPNISLEQFADIYQDFGYNEAIYRDDNSLSYICQPHENLWILGIDNFTYKDNGDGTYAYKAAFNEGTMTWIQEKMAEANSKNIRVLAMLHSGILEHYTGQKGLEGGYVSGFPAKAPDLLNAGIKLVFNGHHHGNDITELSSGGKTLVNIETGSLVTPMSPYRIMTLDDNFIKVETRRITSIDSELPSGMDFLTYSDLTIKNRLDKLFINVAQNKFGHTLEEAQIIAPFISRAWLAHFAGDEKISPEEMEGIEELAEFANPALINAIHSIWTDLPPYSDNKIHIKLK